MTVNSTRRALVYQLKKAGIPRDAYSFGEAREGAYYLIPFGAGWKVFAFERGKETEAYTFQNEGEASRYLLGCLVEAHRVFRGGYDANVAYEDLN